MTELAYVKQLTEHLAFVAPSEPSRETCTMENRGDYMPSHEFRRWKCSACGGMHWEQANIYLRFRFCPHCGARVDFEAEGGADA